MKIINTATNETVAEIVTNHSMTLDEAIALVGSYSNDLAADGEPEVCIAGNWYYYDDLRDEW